MIYVLSGGAKAFAVIGVTYPAGSVCTCTDGSKTLKLKDTSGQGFFLIPYAAVWTVTASDGTNTKSQSVEITSKGQNESVALSYLLVLFDNGVVDGIPWTTKPDGGTAKISDTLYVSNNQNEYVVVYASIFTTDKLDLTLYSKMHFTVSGFSGNGGECGVCSSNDTYNSRVAYTNAKAKGDFECDISSISEPLHIYVMAAGHYPNSLTVSKIWLD